MGASLVSASCHVVFDEGFRAIFEGALDPMLLADDAARYVDANAAACVFLGLSRAEICSRRVVDLTPAPAKTVFTQVWQAFLQDGKQQGEYEMQLPDGRIRDVEFSATADVLPGGIYRSSAIH